MPTRAAAWSCGQDGIDAGNLTLTIDPGVFASAIDVIGTMPGYDEGQLGMGTTSLLENTIGIWTLNNTDYLISPPSSIPAGTYRFKFVKDYLAGTGWGGSLSDTLTAPVTLHPCAPASTPATDIVVRFPTSGVYAFTLDERRQRFSIALAPVPASPFARR